MKPTQPKNSARIEEFKQKLKQAQKSPLRKGFLSQDKFTSVKTEPKKHQIS